MSEADKPRPLAEHQSRALETYGKLCDFARSIAGLETLEAKRLAQSQLIQLRQAASTGFWLYPVIEAKHGLPR